MTHLQITMSIFGAIEVVLTVTVLSFRLISCPFLSYREMIQFYESEQSELSLIYCEL